MGGRMSVRKLIVAAFAVLIVQAGQAMADEALAKRAGCLNCHSVDSKLIGPAYRDVAARYKGNPRARDTLKEKVKKGGKGNWTDVTGGVPMPPHSALLSDAEIRTLVDWVLSR
jgi:cytochrome c